MIEFPTVRFGRIEVEEDRILHFPQGLLGFRGLRRYILMDYKDTHLKWLQAVDDPEVAFIVIDPSLIEEDYARRIDDTVRQSLGIEKGEDLAILVTIRVHEGKVIANLSGPIVINAATRTGMQVVLDR